MFPLLCVSPAVVGRNASEPWPYSVEHTAACNTRIVPKHSMYVIIYIYTDVLY